MFRMNPNYSRNIDKTSSFNERDFLAQKKSLKFVAAKAKAEVWRGLGGLMLETHGLGGQNMAVLTNKEKQWNYHRYEYKVTSLNPMDEFLIKKRP